MPKRNASEADLDSASDGAQTWKPLTMEEMAQRGRKLLTIKKSVLAMRKPGDAPSAPASPAAAAAPAGDSSPAPVPEAKLPKAAEEQTPAAAAAAAGSPAKAPVNSPSTAPAKASGATPSWNLGTPNWTFTPSTSTAEVEKKDDKEKATPAPFSFSTPTSFSFTSPAFKSPFTFAPVKASEGEEKDEEKKEGETKSMFATWTPAVGSTAQFKPLEFNVAAEGSVFGAGSGDGKTAGSSKAEEPPRVSGEEEEEVAFSTRGRVFTTAKREDGTPFWREHGKGPIKINVHKETKRSRIVMRTDGTFQLKMNMRIFGDMGLKKLNDITTFISGFEGDMEPVTYLIKTRIKQEAAALFEALEEHKKKAAELAPPAESSEEKKTEADADKSEDKSAENSEEKSEEKSTEKSEEKSEEKSSGEKGAAEAAKTQEAPKEESAAAKE